MGKSALCAIRKVQSSFSNSTVSNRPIGGQHNQQLAIAKSASNNRTSPASQSSSVEFWRGRAVVGWCLTPGSSPGHPSFGAIARPTAPYVSRGTVGERRWEPCGTAVSNAGRAPLDTFSSREPKATTAQSGLVRLARVSTTLPTKSPSRVNVPLTRAPDAPARWIDDCTTTSKYPSGWSVSSFCQTPSARSSRRSSSSYAHVAGEQGLAFDKPLDFLARVRPV